MIRHMLDHNRARCLPSENATVEEGDEGDYAACVLGLRDYVDKNGFKGVVLDAVLKAWTISMPSSSRRARKVCSRAASFKRG